MQWPASFGLTGVGVLTPAPQWQGLKGPKSHCFECKKRPDKAGGRADLSLLILEGCARICPSMEGSLGNLRREPASPSIHSHLTTSCKVIGVAAQAPFPEQWWV